MAKLAIDGGKPLRKQPFRPRNTMGDEEVRAATEVLRGGVLSDYQGAAGPRFMGGFQVRELERHWAGRYGFEHALAVNSWTSGLMACMAAIGVQEGDEVILPPYTMSATATAVLFAGATPVFADVEPDTFCISPDAVREKVTERTRAIVAVHLFGHPCDMDALRAIADEHGLWVVEDAAQSPGIRYHGEYVGAIGDIGGFSLTQTKHIHCGEGGVIVTDNDLLATRCALYRNHGENTVQRHNHSARYGGNFRLTELQAAIAKQQLWRLPSILQKRQALAQHLSERVAELPGLTPPAIRDDCEHAFFLYPIRFNADEAGMDRTRFVRAVNAELPALPEPGAPLSAGYVRPLNTEKLYQNGDPDSCPVAEHAHESGLVLSHMVREPMSKRDVSDLADAMEKVLS